MNIENLKSGFKSTKLTKNLHKSPRLVNSKRVEKLMVILWMSFDLHFLSKYWIRFVSIVQRTPLNFLTLRRSWKGEERNCKCIFLSRLNIVWQKWGGSPCFEIRIFHWLISGTLITDTLEISNLSNTYKPILSLLSNAYPRRSTIMFYLI